MLSKNVQKHTQTENMNFCPIYFCSEKRRKSAGIFRVVPFSGRSYCPRSIFLKNPGFRLMPV